jgi:hypothetical protein
MKAIPHGISAAELVEETALGQLVQYTHDGRDSDARLLPHEPPPRDAFRRVHRLRVLGQIAEDRLGDLVILLALTHAVSRQEQGLRHAAVEA